MIVRRQETTTWRLQMYFGMHGSAHLIASCGLQWLGALINPPLEQLVVSKV